MLLLVLVVSVFYLYRQPLYLAVIVASVIYYWIKLWRVSYVYQRPRHWLINNGRLMLMARSGQNQQQKDQGQQVLLESLQVWRSLILFRYSVKGKSFHEIIGADAVEPESFRRFRCMVKQIKNSCYNLN